MIIPATDIMEILDVYKRQVISRYSITSSTSFFACSSGTPRLRIPKEMCIRDRGIPIVGVVGGAFDLKYMKEITTYAEIKYRKRYYRNLPEYDMIENK